MWTTGEFGTTGSFHDEEYEVYTVHPLQQQQQHQPQQFYNNQGYSEQQTFYNDDYAEAELLQRARSRVRYWAALSLSFRRISIMLMNIIAWGPQVTGYGNQGGYEDE